MEQERYEGGYTMEEQRALRKSALKFKCHLTENHQLKAADALIKNLNFKLGEAESYIAELEDNNRQLLIKIEASENDFKALQSRFNLFMDKYSIDMSSLLKEPVFNKIQEEKKELKKRIKELEKVRDQLICKLNKYEKLSESNQ